MKINCEDDHLEWIMVGIIAQACGGQEHSMIRIRNIL